MCRLRKLDEHTQLDVCEIHAGLHYVVGKVSSPEKVMVWGRYPDSKGETIEKVGIHVGSVFLGRGCMGG